MEELAVYSIDDTDDDPNYFEDDNGNLPGRLRGTSNDNSLDLPSASESDDGDDGDDDDDDDDGDDEEDDDEDDDDAAVINDDEMEEFYHDLKAALGFKKAGSGRRAGGIGDEAPSFEVKALMGQANQAFGLGQLDRALEGAKKVIQIEAGVYSAWKLLGEIFRKKGKLHRCLLAWLTAAHARPKDWELWLTCARMSLDRYGSRRLNYHDQAIYCLNHAIHANPNHIDVIYDRSLLLKEAGQLHKAVDGFATLHRLLPNDTSILRDMAALLTELGHLPDAIAHYAHSAAYFMSAGDPDHAFGWSELNIFVELHMMGRRWADAIATLKRIARWLYGRADESFWDCNRDRDCAPGDDDRESDSTDERRKELRQYVPLHFDPDTYTLPLELRVKLGVCHIKLGHHDEALRHFKHLDNVVDPVEYYDLFQEAGDALSEAKAPREALAYYLRIVNTNQPPPQAQLDRKLLFRLAPCYKALNRVCDT